MQPHFLSSRRATALRRILIVIVFCVIGRHLFSGLGRTSFHADEAGWLSAGYYDYHLMFVERDFDFSKWLNLKHANYGVPNLPVGKYLIGMALHFALPRGDYFYVYDFTKSWEGNLAKGNIPPQELIYPARLMSAIFAFGACICMFWFATRAWNWLVGLLAATILAFNSLFTLYAHRAMTDSYLVFFFLLTIALMTGFVSRWEIRWPRLLVLAALYGVVVGLCTSVKLNGMLGIIYLACLFGYMLSVTRSGARRRLVPLLGAWLVALLCAGLTVVAIYPYFYTASVPTLLRRAMWIAGFWDRLLAVQKRVFTDDAMTPFSWRFLAHLARYHLRPVLSAFAVAGCLRAAIQLTKRFASGRPDPGITPLIFLAVNLVGIGAWIPLDWDRYYLPIVIAGVPLAAFGVYSAVELLLAGVIAVVIRNWGPDKLPARVV